MGDRRFRLRRSDHDAVSENLSLYIDKQLSAAQVQRVEAHLESCQRCRDDLDTLRWTKRLLQETPALRPPRSFVIREADVADRRPARGRRPIYVMQWAAAAAALLFVAVLAGDLLTGRWMAGVPAQSVARKLAAEEAGPVEAQATVLLERETEAQEVVVTVVVEKEVVVSEAPAKPAEERLAAPPAPTPLGTALPGRSAPGEADRTDTPTVIAGLAQEEKAEGIQALKATGEQEKKVELEAPPSETPSPSPSKEATEPVSTETPEPSPQPMAKQPLDVTTLPSDRAADELLAETVPFQVRGETQVRPLSVIRPRWGWRAAEVGLGLALVVLVLGIVWMRRRK
jgi:anti-sigma factor RsiW